MISGRSETDNCKRFSHLKNLMIDRELKKLAMYIYIK
jgi:hypothetical protein